MHLAVLVICRRILLKALLDRIVGKDHRRLRVTLYHQFKDIEKLARIATTVTHDGCCLA